MRRCFAFLCGWLLVLTASGATPELGKDALRKLVKLPTIIFDSNWTFDPERGFTLGSSAQDVSDEIARLRQQSNHEPADAAVQLHIGDLLTSLNDIASAQKAYGRAAEFYRQRVDAQPGDAMLLCGFGRALQGAGKTEEAESVLRKAVDIAPNEWRCRVALGRFLDADARHNIEDAGLSASHVTLARKELAEASECYDHASVIAPNEGEIYFRRGMHRSLRAMLLNEIRMSEGEQRDEVVGSSRQFSDAALADLQRASRLKPSDYALIGNVVLFEIYTGCSHNGQMDWGDFSWSSLPEKSQHSIHNAETRLENLGQVPDPRQASGALEVLGILQGPILHDSRSCILNLRRAVALEPSRDQAWDVLAGTLARMHLYDELLSVCQERIHQKESARGHLLLAKAYEKLRQWDDSENEIMESLRMAPNSFTANLAEAALVLRRSQDPDVLLDANSWLARSERLLNDLPPMQRNQEAIIELTLTRSIYFALSDQLDEARQWAKAVINQDKNNPVAQEILSAMDY